MTVICSRCLRVSLQATGDARCSSHHQLFSVNTHTQTHTQKPFIPALIPNPSIWSCIFQQYLPHTFHIRAAYLNLPTDYLFLPPTTPFILQDILFLHLHTLPLGYYHLSLHTYSSYPCHYLYYSSLLLHISWAIYFCIIFHHTHALTHLSPNHSAYTTVSHQHYDLTPP